MEANRFKINPQKTHILTVGTQNRLSHLPHKVKINMNGVQLVEDPGACELLLGCKIQANLKWNHQVSFLNSKLSKRLAALMNLKYILPYGTLKKIVEGMFNSILVYCLPLFGGCDIQYLKELQVLKTEQPRLHAVCHQDIIERPCLINWDGLLSGS